MESVLSPTKRKATDVLEKEEKKEKESSSSSWPVENLLSEKAKKRIRQVKGFLCENIWQHFGNRYHVLFGAIVGLPDQFFWAARASSDEAKDGLHGIFLNFDFWAEDRDRDDRENAFVTYNMKMVDKIKALDRYVKERLIPKNLPINVQIVEAEAFDILCKLIEATMAKQVVADQSIKYDYGFYVIPPESLELILRSLGASDVINMFLVFRKNKVLQYQAQNILASRLSATKMISGFLTRFIFWTRMMKMGWFFSIIDVDQPLSKYTLEEDSIFTLNLAGVSPKNQEFQESNIDIDDLDPQAKVNTDFDLEINIRWLTDWTLVTEDEKKRIPESEFQCRKRFSAFIEDVKSLVHNQKYGWGYNRVKTFKDVNGDSELINIKAIYFARTISVDKQIVRLDSVEWFLEAFIARLIAYHEEEKKHPKIVLEDEEVKDKEINVIMWSSAQSWLGYGTKLNARPFFAIEKLGVAKANMDREEDFFVDSEIPRELFISPLHNEKDWKKKEEYIEEHIKDYITGDFSPQIPEQVRTSDETSGRVPKTIVPIRYEHWKVFLEMQLMMFDAYEILKFCNFELHKTLHDLEVEDDMSIEGAENDHIIFATLDSIMNAKDFFLPSWAQDDDLLRDIMKSKGFPEDKDDQDDWNPPRLLRLRRMLDLPPTDISAMNEYYIGEEGSTTTITNKYTGNLCLRKIPISGNLDEQGSSHTPDQQSNMALFGPFWFLTEIERLKSIKQKSGGISLSPGGFPDFPYIIPSIFQNPRFRRDIKKNKK